jgi:predicted phosphoribosyltransferase
VATGDGDVMMTAMARGGVPVPVLDVAAAVHESFESHP